MSDKKPELVVYAGPNGSGKSTFTSDEWIVGAYINADVIQYARGITTLEAARIADDLREEALRKRDSFTFETVLSTDKKLEFMRRAKEQGYFIRGYFILTCDPYLNVARVASRVESGGHPVPTDTIIRRYERSLKNIPQFLALCDICHVYDNTVKPFRIIRKHKASMSFYENTFWSLDAICRLTYPESAAP